MVLALGALGDLDGVFSVTQRDMRDFAIASGDAYFAPFMAPVRQDPRFWALMANLGVAQYWIETGHWPDICAADIAACKAKAAAAVAAHKGPIFQP